MTATAGARSSRYISSVRAKLGAPGVRSERELVALIERQLPLSALDALREAGITDEELFRLLIPRRTLAHRRNRNEALSREESDRALRLARIITLAEQTFGERERALAWMRKPKARLDGRTPMDMLATEAGAHLVEEWIWQVDDGLAA